MTGMEVCEQVQHNLARLREIVISLLGMIADRPLLTRHFCNCVRRLLCPAESAVRRLIIAVGAGLVASVRLRPRSRMPDWRRLPERAGDELPRRLSLTESLRRPVKVRHTAPPHLAPRIMAPGSTTYVALPSAPHPRDMLDTTRLRARIDRLSTALDNLPREALRVARWRARALAALAAQRQREIETASPPPAATISRMQRQRLRRHRPVLPAPAPPPPRRRSVRLDPLREGRPPGGRLNTH